MFDSFSILVRYTKKMPQVSTDTLLEIGKKMTAVGTTCCELPEEKRMSCSEGHVSTFVRSLYSSWRFLLFSKTSSAGEMINAQPDRPQAKQPLGAAGSFSIFSGHKSLSICLMGGCEDFS